MTPDDVAREHEGLASFWLLQRHGFSAEAIRWWSDDLRAPFDGVFLTGSGPMTQRQRWYGATLTVPDTALARASAGALFGICPDPTGSVIVVRAGDGGPQWFDGLCVTRSSTLAGYLTVHEGIPTTTIERTILDLWPSRRGAYREKLVREAVRLGLTTPEDIIRVAVLHRGARGKRSLIVFCGSISELPISRTKSDAEVYALTLLHGAGIEIPKVNEIFAGGEADLCWPHLMLIIELDGPQFHVLKDKDREKQVRWEAAGFTVLRLPTPVLYATPESLLALAPPPGPPAPPAPPAPA